MKTYSLAEAATLLGLSAQTLRVQIKNGRFRAKRIGPVWMTDERAIRDYREQSLNRPGGRKRKAA